MSWYVVKIQLTFQSFPFSLVLYFRCLSHLFILVLFHDFGINIVFQLIFTIVETPVGIQFLKVTYILNIKHPFQFLWLRKISDEFVSGPIEKGSEYGSTYKHFYFNCNVTTCKLWIITVIAVISLYEATKYVLFVLATGL